ncbi:MAG: Acetyltransferase, family [Rhodospirillales bacterium]|nr:Acetyltransferase, family [Rhodospirillales bacterium]
MIRKAAQADEAAIRACAEAAYLPYVAAMGRKPPPMVADFATQIAEGTVHVAVGDGDAL